MLNTKEKHGIILNCIFMRKKLKKDPTVIFWGRRLEKNSADQSIELSSTQGLNLKQHIKNNNYSFPDRGTNHDYATSSTQNITKKSLKGIDKKINEIEEMSSNTNSILFSHQPL